MATVKPTPTQDENDRAASGEHVVDKTYDGSGLDAGAFPPDMPPPELPELPPETEPGEPEPKAEHDEPAPARATRSPSPRSR